MPLGVGTLVDNIYTLDNVSIQRVLFEKDIGVIFDSELEFDKHIHEKTSKANSIYGLLRRHIYPTV